MKSLNIYEQKFKKYGASPKSLLWKNRGAAHQRFRQFWSEIDFNNKTVLDIGCGFGEFGKFILKRYEEVNYTGIDSVNEFIDIAKNQVPGGKFSVADFNNLDEQYDVVIASGVLNSNVGGQKENLEFRKKSIKKMFSLSRSVLAFNMLGGHPAPENDKKSNIYYSDSLEILEYCMSLTRRVILRHHYNPKDFTLFLYKVKKIGEEV